MNKIRSQNHIESRSIKSQTPKLKPKNLHSYYYFLNDDNNSSEMIANALNDLKRVKYKSHKVYIHNFARFDAIFLLKELVKVGEVNPIIHKGRIVTI